MFPADPFHAETSNHFWLLSVKAFSLQTVQKTLFLQLLNRLLDAFLNVRILRMYINISDYYKQNN